MIKRYCLNIFKYCLDSEKLFKNRLCYERKRKKREE